VNYNVKVVFFVERILFIAARHLQYRRICSGIGTPCVAARHLPQKGRKIKIIIRLFSPHREECPKGEGVYFTTESNLILPTKKPTLRSRLLLLSI
jgi:hypothetical protein